MFFLLKKSQTQYKRIKGLRWDSVHNWAACRANKDQCISHSFGCPLHLFVGRRILS